MSNDSQLSAGDIVEIIRGNDFSPMPGGLSIGSRGTVIEVWTLHARVDYGLEQPVNSARDSIRKIPPPPREDLTVVSWDLVPWWPEEIVRSVKEPTHV